MTSQAYSRTTNTLIAIGVIAAIFYDRAGKYSWLILAIVSVSAIAAVISYFRFHWSQRQVGTEQDGEACELVEKSSSQTPDPSHGLVSARYRVAHSLPHNSWAISDSTWFAARPIEYREIRKLLAEMEKHKWSFSGTLRLQPPTRDLAMTIFVKDGTVRLVPSFSGGHAAHRQKQPLSRPAIPQPPLRFAISDR